MFDSTTLSGIRSDFPALAGEVAGRAPVFLDGPGGTQVPLAVIRAVGDYLAGANANTGGFFATSRSTDAMLESARLCLADFLGAGSPAEIVFGANMTTLTFAVSRAFGRTLEPGDEIVVTQLDHQANVAPWRLLARDHGLMIRELRLQPDTAQLDLGQLDELLTRRTRLVAVGAASNALGTISDVARIAQAARSVGALTYVDAVHYAPHRLIDVVSFGCDFLVCSAYKFFGPHVGVLWGRAELLERFEAYKVPPAPDGVPGRWETGTLNHEGIAGAAAAVDWIAGLAGDDATASDRRAALRLAWQRVGAHEAALFARLAAGLEAIPGVRVHGPPAGAERTPTVAFTLEGWTAHDIARQLAEEQVYVWSGDFYAPNVIEALGLATGGGVVRAGLAVYSTPDDVARLLDGVARLARS